MTCACWTRAAACWRHGGSSMGWPGSKSCIPWWPPRPSSRGRWWSGSRPTGACWWGAVGRRLPGLCGQPAGGGPLSRPASSRPGQVGPRGCQGAGRSGPHRPAQPPPGRRRQPAGRGGQGAGPGPSEPDLDPPAARERPAQRAAGVLPRGAGRAGRQLAEPEALAVLELAPTPSWAASSPGRPYGGRCFRLAGAATCRRGS
jgi:hypothetical protein